MARVGGIDLSLRGAAVLGLHEGWCLGQIDWAALPWGLFGRELGERSSVHERDDRIAYIAGEVCAFAARHRLTDTVIEDYAYSGGGANAMQLAELGGVVKRGLRQLGLNVFTVPSAQARKFLLGKLPRSDVKVAVQLTVFNRFGAPHAWNHDVVDAFVAANWLMSGLAPGSALAIPPPVEVKRGRKAA